nr:hypothetical protein [Demequina rhizosphaerae]
MAEEGAFDEGADAVAFVGVELIECGEVESQAVVLGAAFYELTWNPPRGVGSYDEG